MRSIYRTSMGTPRGAGGLSYKCEAMQSLTKTIMPPIFRDEFGWEGNRAFQHEEFDDQGHDAR